MKQILRAWAATMIFGLVIAAAAASAVAQNLPPPGAYQPIPDFSGTNAGLLFREAINDRLSGAQPISPSFVSLSFANLPAEQDGTMFYCVDCQKLSPCTGGGSGAWALGQNGTWSCAASAGSLSMGGDVTGISSASTVNTVEGGKTPVVTIGANNASGTGTPAALNGFNIAGVLDLTNPAYGVVCSDSTVSCSTTASSSTVVCSGIGSSDFNVGQYVKLDAAGAANTITTPAISSVTDDGYIYNYFPYVLADWPVPGSTVTANGNCMTDDGTPNNSNTSCSTTYCYSVQNIGQTGIGSGLNGMRSAASAPVCDTTGPARFSVMTGIIVTWSVDTNTAGTIIRRCTGASCTPSSIYAVVGINQTAAQLRGPLTSYQYRDNGFPYGTDEQAGTGAVASDLDAKITAISGSNVTLSVAPSRTISGGTTMRHDNSPAIQAAVNASYLFTGTAPNYSIPYLPACSTHYDMAQAVSFWGTAGSGLSGAGRAPNGGVSNTQLRWDGPPGGIMFNLNYTANATIENLGVEGQIGNTPGTMIDENRYPNSGPSQSNAGPGAPASNATVATTPTGLRVRHVECGEVGLCVNLGGMANDENAIFDDLQCSTPNGVGGQICVYSNSQETYNEVFYNTGCLGRDYCFDFDNIGSFVMMNTNGEASGMIYKIGTIGTYGKTEGGQEEGAQMFMFALPYPGLMTLSDWRVSGGSGPWGAIMANGGAATYLNMFFEPDSSTTSYNIALTNSAAAGSTFITSQFGQPLSNLGNSRGTLPATPGLIPIESVNGSAIPEFNCINCTVAGQTVPPIVSTEPNMAMVFNSFPAAQTLTGTAGTALCSMSMQGTLKTATCYLNAYKETGSAQTFTFPTAFSAAPNLLASCGTYNPTATASVLTLPANASMTAETCNVTAIGQ